MQVKNQHFFNTYNVGNINSVIYNSKENKFQKFRFKPKHFIKKTTNKMFNNKI